jgi:8-oxo-dGTP pyrophosphatase MutT (NUDIX family)
VLPPDQYVASLARKRMAVTAFFRDDQGRVLLVNPVYKEAWDLPGGAVEAEESPYAACRREVAEELGLDRPPPSPHRWLARPARPASHRTTPAMTSGIPSADRGPCSAPDGSWNQWREAWTPRLTGRRPACGRAPWR